MKAGDQGWVFGTVLSVFKDGTFTVSANGIFDEDDLLPDHPALPAVARWLAEHGDALRYGQHTPGDWLDVVEAAFDDQVDGVTLVDVVMPALRALLAALTTEETA